LPEAFGVAGRHWACRDPCIIFSRLLDFGNLVVFLLVRARRTRRLPATSRAMGSLWRESDPGASASIQEGVGNLPLTLAELL